MPKSRAGRETGTGKKRPKAPKRESWEEFNARFRQWVRGLTLEEKRKFIRGELPFR